jgi:hypothetical protein
VDQGLLVFVIAAVAAVVLAAWRVRHRAGRERQLMLLCRHAGLAYQPIDPLADTTWLPFRLFARGDARGTENAVWSDAVEGVRVFDYWFTEDRREGRVTQRLTCALIELPFGVPRLQVEPRDALDVVSDAVGLERIEMELEAFNRRFEVRTVDRRFAVAFLDQRMMEALLGLPEDVTVSVNEDRLLLHAPLLPAPQVLLLFDVAGALREQIPPVVASLYPPRPMEGPHEDRWLQGRWTPEPIGTEALDPPGGPEG